MAWTPTRGAGCTARSVPRPASTEAAAVPPDLRAAPRPRTSDGRPGGRGSGAAPGSGPGSGRRRCSRPTPTATRPAARVSEPGARSASAHGAATAPARRSAQLGETSGEPSPVPPIPSVPPRLERHSPEPSPRAPVGLLLGVVAPIPNNLDAQVLRHPGQLGAADAVDRYLHLAGPR